MANPYKTFRIGTDLTINFHFLDKKTEVPVDISSYNRSLSFSTGRGRTTITSATISGAGDTITWEFDAAEQYLTGDYVVSVKLSTEDGTPALTQDFKAFRLSQYGDGMTAVIDLYAYIDFGSTLPIIPTISEETGNWVINGKDTGLPAVQKLYDGEGSNEDGAITQKGTTELLAEKLDIEETEELTATEIVNLLNL